jgi:hypothetical protein
MLLQDLEEEEKRIKRNAACNSIYKSPPFSTLQRSNSRSFFFSNIFYIAHSSRNGDAVRNGEGDMYVYIYIKGLHNTISSGYE